MVANLTKVKNADHGAKLLAAAEQAHRVKDALVLAVDEGERLQRLHGCPAPAPGEPEEKALREAAMLEGLKIAVNVPFQTAALSFEAMQAAATVIEHGNPPPSRTWWACRWASPACAAASGTCSSTSRTSATQPTTPR